VGHAITLGGVMAGGLFVLPGIVAIMALSYVYSAFGNLPLVAALFFGLKAAVLAVVLEAVFRTRAPLGVLAVHNCMTEARGAVFGQGARSGTSFTRSSEPASWIA
jgi:hypothetical protein